VFVAALPISEKSISCVSDAQFDASFRPILVPPLVLPFWCSLSTLMVTLGCLEDDMFVTT
jgi:hypothetical protein